MTESIIAFISRSDATNKMLQCGGNYTAFIDQTTSRFDVWTFGDKIVAINYVVPQHFYVKQNGSLY